MPNDKILLIRGLALDLSLLHSYLLPMFDIMRKNNELVIRKRYGYCMGLTCSYNAGNQLVRCIVPDNCSLKYAKELVGYTRLHLYHKLMKLINMKPVYGVTIPASPMDKFIIAVTIYLSRNTDYYRNTVKWVRRLFEQNCLWGKCEYSGLPGSYLLNELYAVIDDIRKIFMYKNSVDGWVKEAVLLLGVKGFGTKSVMAYLLHSYGLTIYAPIDRYYYEFLKNLGFKGRLPVKNKCITASLKLDNCRFREKCLYYEAMKRFGEYNGLIQSIIYLKNRLSRKNRSNIEEKLIPAGKAEQYISYLNEVIGKLETSISN